MNRFFLILLLVSGFAFSQSVNDYKYAVVKSKFDFLKEKDQYRLNTFTKMFMEKYGFTTFLDDESIPMDIAANNCNKVYIDVTDHSNLLVTKLKVTVKDCTNRILFTSAEGTSREKEYKVAYQQSLREAFKSFDALGYKYNGKNATEIIAEAKPARVDVKITDKTPIPTSANLLNAQPIENGYQLVDTTPKIVLKIFITSNPDVFITEQGLIKGVLSRINGKWIYEFYEGGRLNSSDLNIKF